MLEFEVMRLEGGNLEEELVVCLLGQFEEGVVDPGGIGSRERQVETGGIVGSGNTGGIGGERGCAADGSHGLGK